MNQQPNTTLTELATQRIEQAFPDQYAGPVRIVWWDDGGYLEEIVRRATEAIGGEIGFRAAEEFPLDLRTGAVAEEHDGATPQVWYIGEAKAGRDWFRDIRETGGEVTTSIEGLTAALYDVDPWDIFDAERHDPADRDEVANIILDRFDGMGIPRLDDLRGEILTKGKGQLLDHLLRRGWPDIDRDADTIATAIEQLQKSGIPVAADAAPEAITDTVRRWAVACWLIDAGVPAARFPDAMALTDEAPNPLQSLLRTRGSPAAADIYLGGPYWSAIIDGLDDPWAYAECPVDGALDAALWTEWVEWFEAEDFEQCIEAAERRQAAVALYSTESAWVGLWDQAAHLAQLQQYLHEWEQRATGADPFATYADPEDGSWRIDDQILRLELTGTPEAGLNDSHPATEWLPETRSTLLHERYRDYLETLGDQVETAMQLGNPLDDQQLAFRWWSDMAPEFDETATVAVLLIDALRYDLAQELAGRLDDQYEVRRETRLSVLPSETRFGMAALTPGKAFRFSVGMDDGTLSVDRGGRSLGLKPNRVRALEEQGWEVPTEAEGGWEHHRIAYYDKELDDVGEGEIGDIEAHFRGYIDDLHDLIEHKLETENWDRIYVVTDHGFVLFPDEPTMESIDANAESEMEVKYRRVAGDAVESGGSGVLVEASTPGANYLDTNLRLLTDPRQHFSKQGYDARRYYHGGLLPQECMLSFLRVEK
ncbi:BREX-5 system phosphatase PglZ [Haloglomus halophilum]|uniref:BREX-5 system phosphatase PglZ n=1 Tax=Haloglomus halophilum TaxID=2962672 RepID=UPI0020C9BC3F|nr:BREX-5 system phosphatase PglZ [Haloglomus halophilum]